MCVLRIQGLDMPTAVRYLSESDAALQILGAAYIQHQCYHSNSAKNQVLVIFHSVALLICLQASFVILHKCVNSSTNLNQ